MHATANKTQTTTVVGSTGYVKPISIDIGFRWIDDISIELTDERPDAKLQLKISADIENQKYEVRKEKGRTIRRASHQKISCDKAKEIVVELFEYRHNYGILKQKSRILHEKISLQDNELYTEKTYTGGDDGAIITITFAYTPGGGLRERVENARRITEEQKVVLDKIRHIHRFFQGLETVCNAVEDIHPYIRAASTAILSLYKLCERQKECRDAARNLVDEMDKFLDSGTEALGGALKTNSTTKAAFRSLTGAIEDISKFIEEHNIGIAGDLFRGAISTGYESKLQELKEKLAKAKEGLRDSLNYGTWKRVLNADLRAKLESVLRAHYSSGEGCLENTRKSLLTDVDNWVRGPSDQKIAWVHGHAGSGKSALLNSIAENLERAGIPFTCFPCKLDDPDLSNIHRMLTTIAYIFTEYYGDYRGFISDLVDQPMGRSILTGDVKKQSGLLFGEVYELISPKGANRPSVHVILIDALDECRNHRDGGKTSDERCALLDFLLDFANKVPWIKVLVTSRPEPDVVGVFTDTTYPVHRININDDEWETSTDIRLFVETQSVKLNLGLSPKQIMLFQERAGNLFVWCTTVFRYIKDSKRNKEELINDILHSPSSWSVAQEGPFDSLYTLYQRVLDSAVLNSEDRLMMETILGFIFVASSNCPLSPNAIADMLYPTNQGKGKREWVSNVIGSLSAIIYVEKGTNAVRAYHPSVLDCIKEMLTGGFSVKSSTSIVKPFSIVLEQAHARVFEGCFEIMARDLRFNICELEDSSLLNKDILDLSTRISEHITETLRYASLFWFSHLKQLGLKRYEVQILAFLNSLKTLFWVEALSLMDVIDRGIVILQDCARFFSAQQSITELAGEWERFLLAYGDASKSTPHLYLSALSWLPGSSRLRGIISDSFSPEIPTILNVPEAWNDERWSENVGSWVRSTAYSGDGRLFAAGCRNGRVLLWDARSGRIARESFMSESEVRSIAFSPANRWLASGHLSGSIKLWDLHTDSTNSRALEGHTSLVVSVLFTSDGKRIVSGSFDGSIRVWDVESGTAIGEPFGGHVHRVTSVALSADDTRIVSGSRDGAVRIFDSKTGKQIDELLQGHSTIVDSVACSQDGRLIASSSRDTTIRLWDAHGGYTLVGHTGWVNCVCFSVDGKYLVSASDDRTVCIWNVETRLLLCKLRRHTGHVNTVAFSPDGQNILSGSSDGTVRVWDTNRTISSNRSFAAEKSVGVLCISYVPNSDIIAYGSSDGTISLRNTRASASAGKQIQGHTAAVNALAVSSDGQWLVSGSSDKALRIWDITSGTTIGEPMLGHTRAVTSVAVSPDNSLVASASGDKTVRLWDVTTRQLVLTLEGHEKLVASTTFSVDGNHVISGSWDGTVRMWDTRTGDAVIEPLRVHSQSDAVFAVAISLDGRFIASAASDWAVRVWDTATLSEVHVLKGHFDWVMSLAFSPNSDYIISGSSDNTVRIWNAQTGESIRDPLTGHASSVTSITFSPDGHEFATGSWDGTVRIWDTRAHTELELYQDGVPQYAELDEEALRIHWNICRASASRNDGWIKDGEKLLLWVPWQNRHDIGVGTRFVISAQGRDTARPEVNYRKAFRFSGLRWRDIYIANE